MQYLGGKSRIAKQIAAYLQSVRKPGQLYAEPFVGGASVLVLMGNPRQASDICEDLILMWQALLQGWEPPVEVSEEEYRQLCDAKPSAVRGFVGFGCSFGGKWFGGYARPSPTKNYAAISARSVNKQRLQLEGCEFRRADYCTLTPEDALVYCDPPYANTTKYDVSKGFDSGEFWGFIRQWSQQNTVIVSGYIAPEDFECVLEIPVKLTLRSTDQGLRVERLFRWKEAQ